MKGNRIIVRFSLVLLFLTAVVSVSAGMDASEKEAIFNARWINSEYQPYRLVYQNYVLEHGDTAQIETVSLRADVLVTDSTAAGYSLQWRMYGFRVETDHFLSRQWVNSLSSFKLNYKTTPEGIIQEVSDARALDESLNRTIDIFYKNSRSVPILSDRERLYRFRENLETFLLSSVQEFHQAYGLGYTLGEVVKVPTEVELSLSKQPVQAVIYKKLEQVEDGVATLVTATVLDSVRLAEAVRRYLVPTLQMDTTVEMARPAFSMPEYRQENTGALMMHLPTGWPLLVFDCREIYEKEKVMGEYGEIRFLGPPSSEGKQPSK